MRRLSYPPNPSLVVTDTHTPTHIPTPHAAAVVALQPSALASLLPPRPCAVVAGVLPGSPAEQAGIRCVRPCVRGHRDDDGGPSVRSFVHPAGITHIYVQVFIRSHHHVSINRSTHPTATDRSTAMQDRGPRGPDRARGDGERRGLGPRRAVSQSSLVPPPTSVCLSDWLALCLSWVSKSVHHHPCSLLT